MSGGVYLVSLLYSFLGLLFVLSLVSLLLSLFLGGFHGVLTKMHFIFKMGLVFFFSFYMILVLSGGSSFMIMLGGSTNSWMSSGPVFLLDVSGVFFLSVGLLVSWSIFNFAVRYMWEDPKKKFFLGSLLVFLFFMLVLVSSGNFLFLFLGWEGVGVLSYILISWWFSRSEASSNSLQAVFYNRVGDFGLLGFMGYLLLSGSGFSMWGLERELPVLVFGLFMLGVLSKSSMFLFHPWLPNAMEGPTPVSSLLHSSTMVVASVYLMMRVLDEFLISYSFLYLLGCVTSLVGGVMAMFQMDMKKIIAYSTTSQLGFMMLSLGLGLKLFSLMYLLSHAFFKAMIFMVSGLFIHGGMNNQDVRVLSVSGLNNKMGLILVVLGSLVMISFPYLTGFWSKDLILENMMGGYLNRMLLVLGVLSVLTTTIYSFRMLHLCMGGFGVSGFKLLGMEGMLNVFDYLRLSLGSVLIGLFFFFFSSPTPEVLSLGVLKYTPVALIIVSLVFSLWLVEGVGYGLLMLGGYLLHYNPLFHKIWGKIIAGSSLALYQFDLLFLELLLPRGVGVLMASSRKFGGLLLFILLVLLIAVWVF